MEKQNNNKKSENALREEKILEFWRENKVFSKTLSESKGRKEFVFYEGPPTANGKPGIHHLEARAFKDAIPRYKTMQGYHVRRKGGWDTHGLPVELQVEKKLCLNSKKAIEEYGIDQFNQECKESVWEYVDLWKNFTERIGYWVDLENPYITYENNYIESLWNVVKKVDEQNLLYKDYKVVPWCPRCGTALSSHELAQGYEDVKDISITAKFKIIGFPDAYFLAWTTTPWTLPGNVALAVGKDVDYVKVEYQNSIESGSGNKEAGKDVNILVLKGYYILAKSRISILLPGYKIISEFKGSELVGMQYEPLFPYLKNKLEERAENLEKAFKVYVADFVNTTDGTGIVHTAVMYGADDFNLGTEVGLPKFHLVNPEGNFIEGTEFLAGRFVKEKSTEGKPTMDVDIIKYLQEKNLFYKKELYEHSYPHCWRCKTALIYYARDSWYIRMSDENIKQKMIDENKSINWEPEYTREGRFGEWLSGIKDWAISRERYWGTPLPVWQATDGEKIVVNSVDTLKKYGKKSGNKYTVVRHGEAEHNVENRISYKDEAKDDLTQKGIEQAKAVAKILREKNITKIFYSPFLRTKKTAEIIAGELAFNSTDMIADQRLIELNPGVYDGQTWEQRNDWAYNQSSYYHAKPEGGESHQDAKNRFGQFLYEIDKNFQNENVLIVTHGIGLEVLPAVAISTNEEESYKIYKNNPHEPCAVINLDFCRLPHNQNYELDLHRPYIDEVVLVKDGKEFTRTKEVMDVWFDSGAMPFAQDHYPFENKEWVDGAGFPADYISEAIDQTRGWFYTLHAVGTLMGRGKAYKNVICLGHILDEKGKKMSKSLGNIVDPWEMIEKYGVDTLRLWMYSVNQPGESKNFDEKTVALLNQQVFGLLYNVLSFYELYRDKNLEESEIQNSSNVLDIWILTRFAELNKLCVENLDNYKLLEPVRAIREFVGDLSTWYLRRSRDRIKDGNVEAKQNLYFVLKNLAKILAPFAPFSAEDIWQKLKNENDAMSVHLVVWPEISKTEHIDILENMDMLRNTVSIGLQMRQKAGIPVRQPLASIQIVQKDLSEEYLEILKDELNVKEIKIGDEILLDTNITPELKAEGNYREFLRAVQEARKNIGLVPSDMVEISIETNNEGRNIIQKFEADFKKTAGLKEIKFESVDGVEIKAGELVFKIKIQK